MIKWSLLLVLIQLFLFEVNANEAGDYTIFSEKDSHTTSGTANSKELDPASIKTLIWNIKKTELIGWEKEFSNFGKDRDLFLLQEAYQNLIMRTALEKFNEMRWDMGISFLYNKLNISTGTMIGSRAEPKQVWIKHSTEREPFTQTPKAITFAKYSMQGKDDEILVISVHAINFVTTAAFSSQLLDAAQVIVKHKGPVLLAGDFNTWNADRTEFLFDLAKRLRLDPVEFKNGEKRTKFREYFLDHAFVRGLKIQASDVLFNSKGSDHIPLVIEFSVP